MENLSIFLTIGGFIATSLVVLIGVSLTGRVENRLQLALASGLIVGGVIWLMRLEVDANKDARATVETLFRLDENLEILDFNRKAEKGARSQTIEAIYQFSPEGFAAYKGKTLIPMSGISFTYRTGAWSDLEIDKFAPSEDALTWKALPRTFPGRDGFIPVRGHYSLRRISDEKAMTGDFVCAFIPMDSPDAEPQAGYDVIPCNTVSDPNPDGITILGILNQADETLHVLIKASRVPAAGFAN